MNKILIFSGTRADYGLLTPLIDVLQNKYKLNLAICNMHFSKRFGSTINEINKEKFDKIYSIKNLPKGQLNKDILNSINKGIGSFSSIVNKSKPKLAIILGDRYEMLSAAMTCFFLKIPILHINGGETTTGSLDDNIRNIITNLANYHCPPTFKSKYRINKILNKHNYIVNSGALGAYNASLIKKKNSFFFEKKYKFKFSKKNILITLHPEKDFNFKLKKAKLFFDELKNFKDTLKIFTSSNSDAYGLGINSLISKFVKKNNNSIFIKSFGKDDYLSILNLMDCVVGNSSSGIIEAPILKVPTINIGLRQNGREMSNSIFNVTFEKGKLRGSLKKILKLKKKNIDFKSPYFKKNTPQIILKFINKEFKNEL